MLGDCAGLLDRLGKHAYTRAHASQAFFFPALILVIAKTVGARPLLQGAVLWVTVGARPLVLIRAGMIGL